MRGQVVPVIRNRVRSSVLEQGSATDGFQGCVNSTPRPEVISRNLWIEHLSNHVRNKVLWCHMNSEQLHEHIWRFYNLWTTRFLCGVTISSRLALGTWWNESKSESNKCWGVPNLVTRRRSRRFGCLIEWLHISREIANSACNLCWIYIHFNTTMFCRNNLLCICMQNYKSRSLTGKVRTYGRTVSCRTTRTSKFGLVSGSSNQNVDISISGIATDVSWRTKRTTLNCICI